MATSWLRQLKKRFVGQSKVVPIQRRSLRLEKLEDRLTPVTTVWTGGAVADVDRNGDGDSVDPGETGSLLWSTPGNWSVRVPSFGDDVIFPNLTPPVSQNYIKYYTTDRLTQTPHSVMDLNVTVNSLTIMGPGPTTGNNVGWLIVDRVVADPVVAGSPFVPATPASLAVLGAVTFTGTGQAEAAFQMQFSGNAQNITVTDPAGSLIIGSRRGGLLASNLAGNISIGPFATGPVGILKLGPGRLTLGGANTFDGLVEIDSGTLSITNNNALGTTGVGTVVRNGATLSVNATTPESIEIIGVGVGGGGALNGGGEIDGGVALNPSATIGGSLTIAGVVSGAGDLTSTGFLTLTNANTYLGATFINSGTLTITNDDALSPGNGLVLTPNNYTRVAAGASLILSSGFFSGVRVVDDEVLYLNGQGYDPPESNPAIPNNPIGALDGTGSIATRALPAEFRSQIFLESNASIGAGEFSNLQITGQMANMPSAPNPLASLTKRGKGTVIFPTPELDFVGDTIVQDGTLVMKGPNVLGPATADGGGSITVVTNIPTLEFATLELQGSYTTGKNLTLNGNGFNSLGALHLTDDANDAGPTAVVWTAPVTIGTTTSIATDTTTALTVSGEIGGGVGLGLQKNGFGSLTLTNANTFLGALTLRDGVTTATNNGAFGGAGGAGTSVASGATLVLTDGLLIDNEGLTLSSTLGISATLQTGGGATVWTGLVNFVGNNILGAGDEVIINTAVSTTTGLPGTLEFSNVVSGDAKLRKLGPGELKLTGTQANTFVDTLQIDAGTVSLGKTAGVNAVAGPIIVGDGLGGNNVDVLRLDAADQIPNNRAVTVNPSGYFSLNNFTETVGPLTIQGGEIATGANGSLILTTDVSNFGAADMGIVSGNVFLGSTTRTFNFLPGPAVTFASSLNPAQAGQTVTFTYTAAGNVGDPRPTGQVTFFDGTNVLGAVTLSTGATPNVGVATLNVTTLSVGSHTIRAVYAGDTLYAAQTVTLAQPQVITNPFERLSVTSSADPALPGQAVTFTFNLPANAGDPVAGGTVTFYDGASPISGAIPVVVGTASFTTSTLAVGAHAIRAVYSGDTNYSPAVVTLPTQQIGAPATLKLSSSANPSRTGDPVTFTFTAVGDPNRPGGADPTPTGSVQFFDNGTAIGAPVALVNGVASITRNNLTVGNHTISATYTGDTPGSPTALFLPGAVTLAPVQQVGYSPLTEVQSNRNPGVAVNDTVQFTFTARGDTGDPVPLGSVTFLDNGVAFSTVPVNNVGGVGTAVAQRVYTAAQIGDHVITAQYNGDNFYVGNSTTLAPVQKVRATPNSTTTGTLIVSSSANSSQSGELVTFTLTVYPPTGTVAPGGQVQFQDTFTPPGGTPTTTNIGGPQAVVGNPGVASVSTSTLAVGTHIITAIYSGGNIAGGTVALDPNQLVVNPLALRLSSSNNPAPQGSPITFTFDAITDPTAPAVPAGTTVQFFDGGVALGSPQAFTGGPLTVTTSSLGVGTRAITATVTPPTGNTTYGVRTVTLAPAQVIGRPPAMLLSSNLNPAPPGTLIVVTFTAAGDTGDPTPTGTVQFFDNGVAVGSAVTLSGGSATLLTNSLTPGIHVITASYSGDFNYTGGTTLLVPNQVIVTPPRSQLSTSPNPVALGSNATFTFNVARGSTANPFATGTVDFYDGPLNPNGTVPAGTVFLGTGTLASGTTTFTTNGLAAGTHTITARYTGDTVYEAETITFLDYQVIDTSVTPLPPAAPPPTTVQRFDPSLMVNAVITGGAGAGITKAGVGVMTLNAANQYSGLTTVNGAQGSLVLATNDALPETGLVITAGTLTVNSQVSDDVASLSGSGTLAFVDATGNLTTGLDGTSTTFSGPITGAGTLTKVGGGTLALTGNSPAYTGRTNVVGGTVVVNANQSSAAVAVQNGATFGGNGTVGGVTANPGGTVAPGATPTGTAILRANGPVVLNAGSTFLVQANGTTPGTQLDQLVVTGSANLGGATLSFVPGATFPSVGVPLGSQFVILTASGGFGGTTFAGLAEGGTFTAANRTYQVSYAGNQVTVTLVGLTANIQLASSVNPSGSGQAVTFTATVTAANPADGTPTGSVRFFDGSTEISASAFPTGVPLAGGVASFTTAALSDGPHTITAVYGSTNTPVFVTVGNATLTQSVLRPTTVTLAPQQGPKTFGDPVSFLATIGRNGGATTPGGVVNFFAGSTFLGSAGVDGTGRASFTTTTLLPGTNTIRAEYSGDAFYAKSDGTATQVVDVRAVIAVGADAGPLATVRVYDPLTGGLIREFNPFEGGYRGGVKVAVGDVNHDGVADIVVAAGAGAPGGHVRAFSGTDGSVLASFLTFPGYTGGVNIAAGDVNGDGFADIIIGTAVNGDHVRVFSGTDGSGGTELMSFFAYGGQPGAPNRAIGITVGAGDVNGDGLADIITGTTKTVGHVKAFAGGSAQELYSFLPYGAGFVSGVSVAAGDVDGDGFADILTGANATVTHVKKFSGRTGAEEASFFAFPGANVGVRVGAVDRTGDRVAEILTGAAGNAPFVNIFSGTGGLVDSFLSQSATEPPSTSGIFVGGTSPK